jgi:tetratricopeptide (TPR) repeat protein
MRKMVLLAACLPFATWAVAVAADDRQDCTSKSSNRKLEACTAVIKSGHEPKGNLAAAYRNRGIANAVKKDYDQAIADFSKAIELNPKDVAAYNARAAVYTNKGDYQHAVADVTKAVELAAEAPAKPAPAAVIAAPAAPVKKPPSQAALPTAPAIGAFTTSVTVSGGGNSLQPSANVARGGPQHGGQAGNSSSIGLGGHAGGHGHGGHGEAAASTAASSGTSSSGSSGSGSGSGSSEGSGSGGGGSGGSGGGGSGGGGGGAGSGSGR